jgi:hypothetical protein
MCLQVHSPHFVDEIVQPLTSCHECQFFLQMITNHISSIHQNLIPIPKTTQCSEHTTKFLELYECLLDGKWLDNCFSCQERLKQFAEHVQQTHNERQEIKIIDFDYSLSENEVINDDHDYFETTTMEERAKCEIQETTGSVINTYLSNSTNKVYFKVGRADNEMSLYTCTVCDCTFELYGDILEHYKVHVDMNGD